MAERRTRWALRRPYEPDLVSTSVGRGVGVAVGVGTCVGVAVGWAFACVLCVTLVDGAVVVVWATLLVFEAFEEIAPSIPHAPQSINMPTMMPRIIQTSFFFFFGCEGGD